MLLQSYHGVLHFLPALPAAWPTGRVEGLRARGGFTVGIEWQEGALIQATVQACVTCRCSIRRVADRYKIVDAKGREVTTQEEGSNISFETVGGETYVVTRQ